MAGEGVEGVSQLRSAILGCGGRAVGHAEAYAAGVGAGSLVACCDMDATRLEAFATRFGIGARYSDLSRMVREVQPDLLHVVTRPSFRPAVLEVVLRDRPRAVLVEKPVAHRPSEGWAWIDGCRTAGIPLFVNHQLRFHRPFEHLRAIVQSGALGPLAFGRVSSMSDMLDQGTHVLDLVNFVLDGQAADWILAQADGVEGYPRGRDCPDYMAGAICYGGGLHFGFECGAPAGRWRQEPKHFWNKGLELVGERGRAGASSNHGWWAQTVDGGLQGESVPYGPEDLHAQAALTDSVLRALGDHAETHRSHAASAQASFELIMAAQRSALLRRRVDPHERFADEVLVQLRAALEAGARE